MIDGNVNPFTVGIVEKLNNLGTERDITLKKNKHLYLDNQINQNQINKLDSHSDQESPYNIIAFGINNDNIQFK